MIRIIQLFIVVCTLSSFASAQSESEVKKRVQARAQSVDRLVKSGVVREGPNGLLSAAATLDAPQAQTVQDENRDRQAIFETIAGKSKLSPEEVASMFARRAQKRNTTPITSAMGPCNLSPAQSVDTARLLQYLKQGMNYAAMGKPEPALAEFRQALSIDRNFLGLSQNAASALMALKRYEEAEPSLKDELKLIGCLEPMPDNTLTRFAYMMEVQEKDPSKRSAFQADAFRAQLGKVKSSTHYNLACLHSVQKQKVPALDALRDAMKAGFSNKKSLDSDPDLAYIRSTPEFKQIVSGAGSSN